MDTKRQQKKKKAREQKGRARAAARRHKLQQVTREERRRASLDRRFRDKSAPIVNDPEKKAEMEAAEKRRVLDRLQRNAEILKALEEEYEREEAQKKSINDGLEAEGHHTLKDKIGAIEAKARAASAEAGTEGSIDTTRDSK
jgi:hypothetical protein